MKVRVPRRNSIFQVLFFCKSDARRLRHRRSPAPFTSRHLAWPHREPDLPGNRQKQKDAAFTPD